MGQCADRRRVLTIQLRREAERVEVRITDVGEGIPAAHLLRVFEYGFTTKPGGHGFGLHTCANHVAQVGGTIHAESAGPGQGATFVVRLPVAPSRPTRGPQEA
jgi:signal transduction histidine kinase